MKRKVNKFYDFVKENEEVPMFDETPEYNLDYLKNQIEQYSSNNPSVEFNIETEENEDGEYEKIIISNEEESVEIINNGDLNDFYHMIIDGDKKENLPSESILLKISSIFPTSKYANIETFTLEKYEKFKSKS